MKVRIGIAAAALGLTLAFLGLVLQVVLWWPETRDAVDSDIAGVWRGPGGAAITFRSDHTLTATNVPFQLTAPGLFDQPWSGAGTWRLDEGRRRQQFVQIVLETRTGTELERQWKDGNLRLFFWIGDPDEGNRFIFEKL